ncbi:MAG TPA: excinuclease ABC subunit UvrA [Candidatus Binatia bacterium]
MITGVSGSGKSSLLFDTLYAEGQRRFVQSMSTYTRLFLERMERPDVDFISNIPPAVALVQKNTIRNARSTVGTITEINDHLRLLWTHVGEATCPTCGDRVRRDDPDSAMREIAALPEGATVLVIAPIDVSGLPLGDVVTGLVRDGYRRLWLEGAMLRLDEVETEELARRLGAVPAARVAAATRAADPTPKARARIPRRDAARAKDAARSARSKRSSDDTDAATRADGAALVAEGGLIYAPAGAVLPVVVDRLVVGTANSARQRDCLERAFSLSRGRVRLVVQPPRDDARGAGRDDASATGRDDGGSAGRERVLELDRRFSCRGCGRELPEPTPQLFSFNSPLGACPSCEGFGRVTGLDLDKVIPDPRLSLADGAVLPFTMPASIEMQEWMLRAAKRHGVRTDVPYGELSDTEREFVLDGEPRDAAGGRRGTERFPGVRGFFRWLERKRYKAHVRILIARFRGFTPCEACGGKRLRPEALAVRVGGLDIAELTELPIGEALAWIEKLSLDVPKQARVATLLSEIRSRLGYLVAVGLDYLTLARQARTLSGGEAQRIHLASALGAKLTDTLYCLDEPTVGLHARDSERLLGVLRQLTAAGNTVVLVEHDPVVIQGADHVIDLGPGGGSRGGRVVYAGPPGGMPQDESATARLLAARADSIERAENVRLPLPKLRSTKAAARERIDGCTVHGARENNLKNITVTFPYGRLTCVTGVSGSGKSTLVEQVLYGNWCRMQGQGVEAGACDGLTGFDAFDEVVLMTQAPVGRSTRSNAATYLKAYDEIRRVFAATPDARAAGVPAGHFSFNAPGGRCEECCGMGTVTIEMHFMADVTVPCDACGGARFRPHVLAIRYRGKTIGDVLAMTIDEAHDFFADQPRIQARLAALRAVGLGYLTLGQPTSTLSGGEAQRLKLASYTGDGGTSDGRRLLLFDEPTTGLHLADVARLIEVMRGMVRRGATIIVVEHNLDFIAAADLVVDLGPEGGERGGEVVALGTPAELARRGGTPTADALRALLAGGAPREPRELRARARGTA